MISFSATVASVSTEVFVENPCVVSSLNDVTSVRIVVVSSDKIVVSINWLSVVSSICIPFVVVIFDSTVNPISVVNICVVDCVSETLLEVSTSLNSVVSNSVLFELDIIISNSEMVSI